MKKSHDLMINGTIYHKDRVIINLYAPNGIASNLQNKNTAQDIN